MDWHGALRARLLSAAPVTALVAQRVYWIERPQASGLPAITLQTVSEVRQQHFLGFDGLDSSLVQIDSWAASYAQVQALKEAALDAIVPEQAGNGIHFARAFILSIRDLGERTETQFFHRASIDLTIHHNTI